MATDNTVLSAAVGTGDTVRDLADGSGVKWPAAVVCYATTVTAGANVLQVVTASAPLPVTGTVAISGTVPISGTVTVVDSVGLAVLATQAGSWSVTANAGTNLNTSTLALETGGNLASLNTKTPSLGQALAAASVPVVLTAAQLATLTPVTTVTANQGGTWNVGTVTTVTTVAAVTSITNALPAGTNSIGTVQLGNTPNTTPILANQSDPAATTGSITVVDSGVSSASGQGGQSILTGSPTAGSSVAATLSADTCVGLQVTGTWTGTLSFERSIDGGTTYTPASMFLHGVAGAALASITLNGILFTNCGGSSNFRVRATGAMTGTAAIKLQPGMGDSLIAAALNAGSALIGQTSASNETSTIYEGTTALTPQFASISAASNGTNTIVAGTGGKKIRVVCWSFTSAGTVNANWQDSNGTVLTGARPMVANATAGRAYTPVGVMQTGVGYGLVLNLSGAVGCYGELTYVLA